MSLVSMSQQYFEKITESYSFTIAITYIWKVFYTTFHQVELTFSPPEWYREHALAHEPNISVVVAGPQVVTMTTSCCFRYEEVNRMIILRHLPNIFTAELSSSFFQTAKVGSIYHKGI